MSGAPGQVELTTTVELKGHLIDSLTLSKVADLVHQLGGDYRLNDIRVGSLKKDISSITMTLMAPNATIMQQLTEALTPYGATAAENAEVNTITCQQDGTYPEEAYVLKLPQRVYSQGSWQLLENGGTWVLVLEEGHPRMKPAAALRKGDILVNGTRGLQW